MTPLLVSGQQAPLVTPRDLRPQTPAKPPVGLPQPAPAEVPSNAQELFVRIGDVSVKDGFAEFAADTEVLLAQVRTQRMSVAELYQLAESIEMLYREAGYALVRVLLPPQSLKDGDTLQLIVLDGFVERIDASAVDERSRRRVLTVMQRLVGQRHLSGDALERALTIAGRSPGLEMRSTMAAGAEPGGVVLTLDGKFTRASGSISADNQLSNALGPWQTTLQLTLNEPIGVGMQVYANVSGGQDLSAALNGDAPRRVTGGGFIIPLGNNGLAINPEYTASVSQPVPPPGVPQTLSKFERTTLRLIYPLILNRQEELTITATLDATSQIDTLPEFELTAADGSSLGAFVLDKDQLRVARVGAAWSKSFDLSRRVNVGATLSSGISGIGTRTKADVATSGIAMSRPDADPTFIKFEGNVAYEQPLTLGVQSKSSLRVQKALKGVLPGSELFSLDGEDALSTFVSGSISDDGGWMLRQEFSRPVTWQVSSANANLAPYVFGAAGETTSQLATGTGRGLGIAFGFGLRMQLKNVNFSMEYGRHESDPSVFNDNQFFVKGQVQF
ncbi:MAG: ShlB/FhaC/HecB family hemolysin secretion/activation protein [Rhodoferax sp.]|uniref:ShlB/FhaC/HecB family hemolysin secretion/activation protein n=1 Tax=Rhodoferax sp. TaxID=50421 RepID=UPI00140006A6|nr:ShlB/FhaC/HecB family hemolysin secretion/activation protein [Rhodoferax sp.]NDP38620.1 ShlB/FhaC/HecB family hemolysin secretion/activation protein [Rhodoferax sp.]